MKTPHSRDKLRQDLVTLGVEPGDSLFVHSSFKSLGPVQGGAGDVVAALEDAVGPKGLVLMPSFNLVEAPLSWGVHGTLESDIGDTDDQIADRWSRSHAAKIVWRSEKWDLESTPSTVGWLTEYFRRMFGTYRSDHYSHSVAARGQGAKEIVAGHLKQEGMKSPWDVEPWGRTFGTHSPMYRAYEANGKLLMLGVDYQTSSYVHLVEVMYRTRNLDGETVSKHPAIGRPKLGEFWERVGSLSVGYVGDAECRLFRIREYVQTILREVESNPDAYVQVLY